MNRLHVSALLAAAMTLGLTLPVGAHAQTTVSISGLNENSEGACSQATVIIVNSDCTYSNQRGDAFYGWSGPNFGGGFYAVGSIGDDFTYVPVAGDAKIKPTITGALIITSSGAGATIEGTFIMGPAVRNTVVGNLTRGVERWDSITHTLAPTAVTTAVPNGGGGFDYVIANNGKPGVLCLTADPSKCYPAEVGSNPLDDAAQLGQNIWNNDVPPAVGVEGTPLNGGPTPNIGTSTTAVISNYSNSCAVPNDCINGRVVWGATPGLFTEDPGWDNLLLAISTDAAGNITSGEAWWTEESRIEVGPQPRSTNSWQGSRFTFTGAAEGAASACADFGAGITGGSVDNEIDARSRCTGFDGTPAITIVTGPASGNAVINAAGNIVYTPNGGFSGTDTLTFNGNDGTSADDGLLTLTVSPDPAPVIADGSIDTSTSNTLVLTVTLGNGSASEHTLAVTTDGTNGNCTVPTDGSFSVTYAPNRRFAGQDTCTLTLTDTNGDNDTALISITVPDDVITEIDGGGGAQDPWSLALLGGLAVLLRRRNRAAAIALAVVLTGPALADEWIVEGAYVGTGVIGTELQSNDPSALTAQLDQAARPSSANGAALALGMRWQFARRWAIAGEGETLWVNFDDAFDEPWRIGLSIEYWFGAGKAAD